MAAKKDDRSEQQIANDDQLTKVSDLTGEDAVAKVDAPKTVKVKSPAGFVTEVPEGIVEALLDSGYSKTK